MTKLGFRRRRGGFTLVEVLLASVAGSAVLMALAYTSREMSRAVESVHNEAFLQTLVREMQYNLDDTVPVALSAYVNTYPDPATVPPIPFNMPKYSQAPASGSYARVLPRSYFSLGMGAQAFMLAAKPEKTPKPGDPTPTPAPTPTPTPAPTATPAPTPSQAPTSAPSASPTTPSATATPADPHATAPPPVWPAVSAMPDDYEENAEVNLGGFVMRFQATPATMVREGGDLMITRASGLMSTVPIGRRGMIADTKFAYGDMQPPVDNYDGRLDFALENDVKKKMFRLTATMGKGEMVPFYLQSAWAPRAAKWSWNASPPLDPTIDYDGDGSTGPADPTPFGGDPPNTNIPGGLIPALVGQPQLVGKKPGDIVNCFDGAQNYGGPSAQKGWTSWENDGSASYLKDSIQDPSSKTYVNPTDPTDNTLGMGDSVWPNTGNSTSGTKYLTAGQEVTVVVWDTYDDTTGYHIAGFARVRLIDWDSKAINATFLGWCTPDGTLVEDFSAVGPG